MTFFVCALIAMPVWATVDKAELRARIKTISVPFIENQGQVSKEVRFYAHTFSGTVFITKDSQIIYALPKYEGRHFDRYALRIKTTLEADCDKLSLV